MSIFSFRFTSADLTITGNNNRNTIVGHSGNDTIDGQGGNEILLGGRGNDTVSGGSGNDHVFGGWSNDTVRGGSGNDRVWAGWGDDTAVYNMSDNIGDRDRYDGGRGTDSLVLELTNAQWMSAEVQADIVAFREFVANNQRWWSGETNSRDFHFTAFNLTVEEFESIRVVVDGVEIDSTDQDVIALDDAYGIGEDAPATTFSASVLDNDDAPNLVRSVTVVTAPAKGVLVLNDDGTFSYDPAGEFESLGAGQSETVTFTYEVEDADGDTAQATATITIEGANDTATISGNAAGDMIEDQSATLSTSGVLTVADVDAGQAVFTPQAATAGSYGAFSITANGDWDYAADNAQSVIQQLAVDETLSESFTVVSVDGTASQIVTVTITGVNDGPSLAAAATNANEDGIAVNVDLATLGDDVDSDNDGTNLTYTVSGTPSEGAASITGNTLSFDPGADFQDLALNETRDVVVQVTATDAHGATAVNNITVTVTGNNEAPVATDVELGGSASVLFVDDDRGLNGNTTWTNTLTALGHTVDYEAISASGHPTSDFSSYDLIVWSNGDQAYTNLTGANVNAMTAYLDQGGSLLYAGGHNLYSEPNISTLTANYLGVSAYNYNMPYISNGTPTTGVEGNYTLNSWAGGYYGGTMITAFAATTATSLMELTSWNASQNDIAAVNLGANFAAATWGFDINQLGAAYQEDFLAATLSAMGLTGSLTDEDTAHNIAAADLVGNDADANGDTLVISAVSGLSALGAVVVLNGDGSVTYDPTNAATLDAMAGGDTMEDTFTYTVSDGNGGFDAATVTLRVSGVNDAPVVVAIDAGTVLESDAAQIIDLLAGQTDVDTGAVLAAINITATDDLGAAVAFTNNNDGTITIDPALYETLNTGENRVITVAYDVSDGTTTTANTATLTVDGEDPAIVSVTNSGLFLSGYSSSQGMLLATGFTDSNNDGTFETISTSTTIGSGAYEYGGDFDDLDGDGDVDFVFAASDRITIYTNEGDTDFDGVDNFAINTTNLTNYGIHDVTIADFNSDGILDIAAMGYDETVLFGQGDVNSNGLIDASDFSVSILSTGLNMNAYGVDSGDINGDGYVDIIRTQYSQGPLRVFYSDGPTGTFTLDTIDVPSNASGLGVDLGDLDGDGDLDFVFSAWSGRDDFVYYNEGDTDGDGPPEFTPQLLNVAENNLESQLFDIDQDGDLDVVVNSLNTGVTLYLNDGGRSFTQVDLSTTSPSSYGIAVGDIDQDGDADIVQISRAANSSVLFTNLGDTNNDGIVDFVAETLIGSNAGWDGGFINSDDFVFV